MINIMKTEILNTNLEDARERIANRKVQRLSVDLACSTNLEILITPLGNNWDTNRLTGTDENYVAIGVLNFGCYPFRLDGEIAPGYLATKLNLPYQEAEDLAALLNNFKINFN